MAVDYLDTIGTQKKYIATLVIEKKELRWWMNKSIKRVRVLTVV